MPAAAFIEARDFLLAHREDYETACRDFRWPILHRFNWALDYFDPMAAGNDRPGLWIVDEGGGETNLSFAELAERSSRVANHLRALGVRRGDRLLLMLGNVAPLWECMLAAMKLGAVIIPATTLLNRDDLLDRFARGRIRHVVAGADNAGKFADLPGDYTRIAVGGIAPAWQSWEAAYDAPAEFAPDGETRATDPLLLYFTSGTTAKPKLVLHSHQSYPVGIADDDVLARHSAGRHPPQHLLAGLGQARLELLFRAVERRGDGVHAEPAAVQREGAARCDGALPGHHVLRAADGVAHADPGGSGGVEGRACARSSAPANRSTRKSSSGSNQPGA